MQVEILGPVEARVATRSVRVGGPGERALLAMLALAGPRVVAGDALIDGLWGDDPPKTAGKVIQNQVMRIRKAWCAAGAEASVIDTVPGGYVLALPSGAIDVHAIEAMAVRARTALADGHDERAAELFRDALRRWRGTPLADVGSRPFVVGARPRLEELKWLLLEQWADAELACGRHQVLVTELHKAVAAAPLRERLWEQLMLALYANGRQAEALRAFQDFRERLVDLGLGPGPAIVALERAIATDDTAVLPTAPARSWANPTHPWTRQLPQVVGLVRPRTRLFGRREDLRQVASLLDTSGAVSIVGPGGVGKTRLALEVVARASPGYSHGVTVVDLSAVQDDLDVTAATAGAAGLVPSSVGEPPLAVLVRALAARRTLIVLDNCEHVIAGTAAMAETVTQRCPGVHILATSREALCIDGEAVWRLAPLAAPDPDNCLSAVDIQATEAVQLFVDRVRLVQPRFELNDANAPAVASITAILDGIPLAIELAAAAAATDVVSLDQLVVSLGDFFTSPSSRRRMAHERQRSLWATIEWSYRLLSPPERRLFERLSVFATSFDRDVALEVCAGDGQEQVRSILERLVARSLLHPVDGDDGRLRMLATVRQFAGSHLRLSKRSDQVSRRLVRWAEHFVADATWRVELGDDAPALKMLDQEYANIRAALHATLEHGDARGALSLAGALGPYWNARSMEAEGHRLCEAALELPGSATQADLRPRALLAAAQTTCHLTNPDALLGHAASAAAAAQETGDKLVRSLALSLWGLCISSPLWGVSITADAAVGAARALEEAAALALAVGNHVAWAIAIERLSFMAKLSGDHDREADLLIDAAAAFRGAVNRRGLLWCLAPLALIRVTQGDVATGLSSLEECVVVARALGYPFGEGWSLAALGMVRMVTGDGGGALAEFRRAERIFARIGAMQYWAWAVRGQARASLVSGDLDAAASALCQVLDSHLGGLVPRARVDGLVRDTAVLATACGALVDAARLVGSLDGMGAPRGQEPPEDQQHGWVARVCTLELGEHGWAQALGEGRHADPLVLVADVIHLLQASSPMTIGRYGLPPSRTEGVSL